MGKQVAGISMTCLLTCLTVSCLKPAKTTEDADVNAIAAKGHWVSSARLKDIMNDLDREVATSWPQEIDNGPSRMARSQSAARSLEDACWLAEGLRVAAGQIPDAVAKVDMSEVDRRSFLAQVHTLQDQAARLETVAGRADVDGMRAVLSAIDDTCQSCHVRFRDFSGPLKRP